MKAAVLGENGVELRDVPQPEPGPASGPTSNVRALTCVETPNASTRSVPARRNHLPVLVQLFGRLLGFFLLERLAFFEILLIEGLVGFAVVVEARRDER